MADGAKIAKQARNSAPNAGAFGDCPRCDKLGLPILPLRFAYTPKKEVSGKAAGAPDVVNEGNAFAGGDMVVRVLSDGYLYVLDERDGGKWRAFAVTRDGALWEFPPDAPPKSKAEFNCGRTGHSVKSSMFSIPKPAEAKRVWMAYTSVVLTKAKRDAYKAACLSDKPSSEDILLKDRFQEYSVAELMNNPKPRTGFPAFSVDQEGKLLAHYVPEYAGLHTLFNQSLAPGINRQADAREAGQRMHRMMPGHGAAVILHDPVGLAMEIRAMANAAHAKLADVDKKYARQLRVDRAIDQIGKSFIKSGKQEEWEEDYLSGVDPSKRNAFKKAYENETKLLREQRTKFCSDYVAWQGRSTFTVARDGDYDNEDSECCKAFSQQMAAVLDGVGLTENERAFALESLAKIDNNNLWFRVLTGNQKTLMDYLLNEKRADLNDMFKNTYSAVDEWIKTYDKLAKELRLAANQPIPAGAAASEPDAFFRATLPVGEAIKRTLYNVQGFLSDAKLVSLKQFRVLALAGLLWFNITAVPFVEEMTAAVAARKQKQAVWKQTLESRLTSMVDADGAKVNRMNVGDVTDELGDIAHARIRVVVFAFVVADSPQGRLVFSGQLNYEAVIARLQANGTLTSATGALGDTSVSQLVRSNPAVNSWDETLKVMRNGGMNGVLAVFVGAFQGISLSEAIAKHGKTPGTKPAWQIASASIGILGAAAEIAAASITVTQTMRNVPLSTEEPGRCRRRTRWVGGHYYWHCDGMGWIGSVSEGGRYRRWRLYHRCGLHNRCWRRGRSSRRWIVGSRWNLVGTGSCRLGRFGYWRSNCWYSFSIWRRVKS